MARFQSPLFLIITALLFSTISSVIVSNYDGASTTNVDDSVGDSHGLTSAQKQELDRFSGTTNWQLSTTQYKSNFAARSPSNYSGWVQSAGGSGSDMIWDMHVDGNGDAYVTGAFSNTATFGSYALSASAGLDPFIAKMSSNGTWLWAKQGSGNFAEWGTGITTDPSGNVYVSGLFMDESGANSPTVAFSGTVLTAHSQSYYDMFIVKYDNNGNLIWAAVSPRNAAATQAGGGMAFDCAWDGAQIVVVGSWAGEMKDYTTTLTSTPDSSSTYYTDDIFIGWISSSGLWQGMESYGGNTNGESAWVVEGRPNGDGVIIGGQYQGSVNLYGQRTSTSGSKDIFIVEYPKEVKGMPLSFYFTGGSGDEKIHGIAYNSDGHFLLVGEFDGVLADFGGNKITSAGDSDIFVTMISNGGGWLWAQRAGGSGEDIAFDVAWDGNDWVIAGQISGQGDFESNGDLTVVNSNGGSDGFVAMISDSGDWQKVELVGGPSGGDRIWALSVDNDGDMRLAGRFKAGLSNPAIFGLENLTSAGDFDAFVWRHDWDLDGDMFPDDEDTCPETFGTSTMNSTLGCVDSDGDGWADLDDDLPNHSEQWRDIDEDGFGDNMNGSNWDFCQYVFGNSTEDNKYGCPDIDGDGWANSVDVFPNESTQWLDNDWDGFGDNWADGNLNSSRSGPFTNIGQWVENAWQPDACPTTEGYSFEDQFGCPDLDSDGWSNVNDALPADGTQHSDRDGDGHGDIFYYDLQIDGLRYNQSGDALPDNPNQWRDRDGDGYGDRSEQNDSDAFIDDSTQWSDVDEDGFGDNPSGFQPDSCLATPGTSTRDRFGCNDNDGDGFSNPTIEWNATHGADAYPEEWSQWSDLDGDGLGDNWAVENSERPNHWPGEYVAGAVNPDTSPLDFDNDGFEDSNLLDALAPFDSCPQIIGTSSIDRSGCIDYDGDGYSDLGDSFTNDSSQWNDTDGDGYGDAPGGHQADACPTVAGTSFEDRIGCPDSDQDGYSNPMDAEYPWTVEQGADSDPYDSTKWNRTEEVSEISGNGESDGFAMMALGMGIVLAFAVIIGVIIVIQQVKGRNDYSEYDDEGEYEEEETGVEIEANDTTDARENSFHLSGLTGDAEETSVAGGSEEVMTIPATMEASEALSLLGGNSGEEE